MKLENLRAAQAAKARYFTMVANCFFTSALADSDRAECLLLRSVTIALNLSLHRVTVFSTSLTNEIQINQPNFHIIIFQVSFCALRSSFPAIIFLHQLSKVKR